ncbi:polysaccharide pyruvyl transferase family protein [Gluconacetobacter sacchari]|uniref:polysaccharide pyruvyl transferase family protein n=1 Tax=Gluconacetobacter sacchari TaxID=92759 RepID=UPI0039B3D57E
MVKAIKLYWWQSEYRRNMGDEISREIVEFVSGRRVFHAHLPEADMLAVGSVLSFTTGSETISRTSPYIVWGAGTLDADNLVNQEKYLLSALRGPLTYSLFSSYISNSLSVPFGDPGILVSSMWEKTGRKDYSWGIIPHHSQLEQDWVKKIHENTPRSIIIDTTNPDVRSTVDQISRCEFIASSSLHGLVFSDSYKIPSIWLWNGPLHGGDVWKFLDYFSGIGRKLSQNFPCQSLANLNEIENNIFDTSHFGNIEYLCRRLVKNFPI